MLRPSVRTAHDRIRELLPRARLRLLVPAQVRTASSNFSDKNKQKLRADWQAEFGRWRQDKRSRQYRAINSSSASSGGASSSGYSSAEGSHHPHERGTRPFPRVQWQHSEVSALEMLAFLRQLQLEPEDRGDVLQTRYCPVCPKPHNEERTNLYTFGVRKQGGLFNCFRCNQSGNWH